MDTMKEIEILTAGLKRYPNSDRLKNYLAFSYSMVHRMAEEESVKQKAAEKTIALCGEVIRGRGGNKQKDDALITLCRLYIESEKPDQAMEAVAQLSPENHYGRIAYTAAILASKKEVQPQLRFVEDSMFHCWLAMCHILDGLGYRLMEEKQMEKALDFHQLYVKLLALFDEGGEDFYATAKMMAAEKEANLYQLTGDSEACMDALERFFSLAEPVRRTAKAENHHISARNIYFAQTDDPDLQEEFMSEVFPERVLKKYESLLIGNDRFEKLKHLASEKEI